MAAFPPMAADEETLWEGCPVPGLQFGMATMAASIFAVALVLGCLGIATVVERSVPGVYWTILAPGLILGAVIFLVPLWRDAKTRTQTRYRITSRQILRHTGRTVTRHQIPDADQLQPVSYTHLTLPTIA